MKPNRRQVLGLGLTGAALLAVGGLGLGLRGTVLRPPRQPLQALAPRPFSILAAIADTLCPAVAGLPAATELDVPEKVDAVLATLHPAVAEELGLVLLTIENALPGLVFDGRPRPFTRLQPEARARALDRWRTSRLRTRRMMYRAVSGLVMAAYWGDPALRPHVGYDGPPSWLVDARDAVTRARREGEPDDG